MLEPRPASYSRTETTHVVLPGNTNALHTIFGGTVMHWIDEIAAVTAQRHAAGGVVTASVDAIHFLAPIHVGAIVVMRAQVNLVGRSSMEVGVRVEVEDPRTGERKKTTKAYLTFVAIDVDGRPREVPPLRLIDDEDRRRERDAKARRAARLAERPSQHAGGHASRDPQ